MSGTLFVYGTLQPEKAPPVVQELVRRFELLGPGTVRGHLFDFGEYPGLVLDAQAGMIPGKVFRMPSQKATLARLDAYEEYFPAAPEASLFRRKRTRVAMADGTKIDCWIYEYNQPVSLPLPASDQVHA